MAHAFPCVFTQGMAGVGVADEGAFFSPLQVRRKERDMALDNEHKTIK